MAHLAHTPFVNIKDHVNRKNLRLSVGINDGLAYVNGKYMTVAEYERIYPEIPLMTWSEANKGKNPDGTRV